MTPPHILEGYGPEEEDEDGMSQVSSSLGSQDSSFDSSFLFPRPCHPT